MRTAEGWMSALSMEQVKRRQNDATELATHAHFNAIVLVPEPRRGRLSRPKRRLTGWRCFR